MIKPSDEVKRIFLDCALLPGSTSVRFIEVRTGQQLIGLDLDRVEDHKAEIEAEFRKVLLAHKNTDVLVLPEWLALLCFAIGKVQDIRVRAICNFNVGDQLYVAEVE